MKRLLILLSLACPVVCQGASLFPETYEANPGYDQAWDNTTEDGSSTLDEDYATSSLTGGAPDGWGDDCLQIFTHTDSDRCYNYETLTTQTTIYVRVEVFTASALTEIALNKATNFYYHTDASNARSVKVEIKREAGGDSRFQFTYFNTSNAASNFLSDNTLSANTAYRVEFYMNTTTDAYEWLVDGVSQDSGTDATGLRDFRRMHIGNATGNQEACTLYVDNVDANNSTWVEGPAGSGSIPKIQRHYFSMRNSQ